MYALEIEPQTFLLLMGFRRLCEFHTGVVLRKNMNYTNVLQTETRPANEALISQATSGNVMVRIGETAKNVVECV